MLEKIIAFAENGNGRRLLNTLNKGIHVLTPPMLNEILKTYCAIGLPKEVEALKKRRGILKIQFKLCFVILKYYYPVRSIPMPYF